MSACKRRMAFGLCALALLWLGPARIEAAQTGLPVRVSAQTAFLVVAPDRGALGNRETAAVFEEFHRSYAPAALAYVGRAYNRPENEYAGYLVQALQHLQEAGASEIVAIPLFLSAESPAVQEVAAAMPAYPGGAAVLWKRKRGCPLSPPRSR
ncbi:MAG: hypothetical protein ACREI3_05940 [Nitrospirales bacterium]